MSCSRKTRQWPLCVYFGMVNVVLTINIVSYPSQPTSLFQENILPYSWQRNFVIHGRCGDCGSKISFCTTLGALLLQLSSIMRNHNGKVLWPCQRSISAGISVPGVSQAGPGSFASYARNQPTPATTLHSALAATLNGKSLKLDFSCLLCL